MNLPRAGLTPRAKVLLPLFLLVLLGLSYWRLRPTQSSGVVHFTGRTMGTTYQVTLGGEATSLASDELRQALQAELDRVSGLMSTYDENSELSKFNASSSTEPFAVSRDTAQVVAAALEISKQSGGAFDVTVAPLVALWGFGAGAQTQPPTPDQVEGARRKVGYQRLSVSVDPPTLTKSDPDLHCDLSAIAKGYGVDKLADLLEARGAKDYLVEVGGEIRVSGHKAEGRRWRIGIERPDSETRDVKQALEVDATGMATSGDYRNYYEKDGKRVSHTIDARTGYPIDHGLASVSVLHPSCMWADGYATAINVLGPQEGLALAKRLNLAVSLIVRQAGDFKTLSSPVFDNVTASPLEP